MRNLVREPALMAQASVRKWTGKDAGALCDVMTGINTEEAAAFILSYLKDHQALPDNELPGLLRHAARFGAPAASALLTATARERAGAALELQFRFFNEIGRASCRERVCQYV